MTDWQDKILDAFFDHESISHLLPYFCKLQHDRAQPNLKLDVISSTLIIFLTSPLEVTMNALGASFFHEHTTLLYPYHLMSTKQKKTLIELFESKHEFNIINNHVVFKKSPTAPVTAPLSVTLHVLCEKIFSSKAFQEHRIQVALCNIIMQRIQGYVPISASVQKELNRWIQSK